MAAYECPELLVISQPQKVGLGLHDVVISHRFRKDTALVFRVFPKRAIVDAEPTQPLALTPIARSRCMSRWKIPCSA